MTTAAVRGLSAATFAVAIFAATAAFLPAHAADLEIKIDNFTFSPDRLTVKAGATVTWTNRDDIPHTVTSSSKLFRSNALDTDDKYGFTFATPGVYQYFCSLHPHMVGTIVVEAQTGSNAAQSWSVGSRR